MELAQLIDDQHATGPPRRQGTAYPSYRAPLMLTGPKAPNPGSSQGESGGKPTTVTSPGGFKKLSDSELREKRIKGLCFRCDEKFTPGHRCKEKTLQLVIVGGSDDETEGEAEGAGIPEAEEEEHIHLDLIDCPVRTIEVLTVPMAMRMEGDLAGLRVRILVDSGATHNFISPEVVKRANLVLEGDGASKVILGSGQATRIYGICRGVEVSVQIIVITQDFKCMQMGGYDVILGMTWLKTLGVTTIDWQAMTMEIDVQGYKATLFGDLSKTMAWYCPHHDKTVPPSTAHIRTMRGTPITASRARAMEHGTRMVQEGLQIKRAKGAHSVWDRLSPPNLEGKVEVEGGVLIRPSHTRGKNRRRKNRRRRPGGWAASRPSQAGSQPAGRGLTGGGRASFGGGKGRI